MTTLTKLKSILPTPTPAPPVHFHQGPQRQPAPCFDAGCKLPRMDVDA